MNLKEIPIEMLEREIERRKRTQRKLIKLKQKPVFKCRTCGELSVPGDFSYFGNNMYGTIIWHRKCTNYPNEKGVGAMFLFRGEFDGVKAE